jgi:hypothetical protein
MKYIITIITTTKQEIVICKPCGNSWTIWDLRETFKFTFKAGKFHVRISKVAVCYLLPADSLTACKAQYTLVCSGR